RHTRSKRDWSSDVCSSDLPGGHHPGDHRDRRRRTECPELRKGVVTMSKECKGTVAQVQGPVIDVQFPQGELPSIQDALWLEAGGQRRVMEVAQHVGRDTVRCF